MTMRLIEIIAESKAEPWKSWPKNVKPTLDYHVQGDSILWIDMFAIPSQFHGTGSGRKLWQYFEASLPAKIKTIKLVASDAGSGPSVGFWQKMGFVTESKGKNGHVMVKNRP